MDLLYRAYSNPLDLMNRYINQGRFGEFVTGFIEAENQKRLDEYQKEKDMKLWIAYIHSDTNDNYDAWKMRVDKTDKHGSTKGGDESLDNDGIVSIINSLFPETSPNGGEK